MGSTAQVLLYLTTLVVILALIHVPLGQWMHRVFTDEHDWRAERLIYRLVGVDPRSEQRWSVYSLSVLAFGVVSVGFLWLLILVQGWLPWGMGRGQNWHTALNTAISFTTNTNWQSYAGEAGAGHTVQMVGLTVQNFVSAATGLAVAIALTRGIARQGTDRLGNFWVDLTRSCVRVLLPMAAIGAVLLIVGGVIQNLDAPQTITSITGQQQVIQGGPVASQEAIKLLGTNGGGFFNANSAHPFENPNGWTNLLQILLVLMIPFSLPWTYGQIAARARWSPASWHSCMPRPSASRRGPNGPRRRGSPTRSKGKEARFGIVPSVVFGAATTGTSTGAVNSMHESYSALGGGLLMLNMQLGEVSPGGVGTGLYGMLVMVVITVFSTSPADRPERPQRLLWDASPDEHQSTHLL